jgi:uncharacterized membrane protein YfcA
VQDNQFELPLQDNNLIKSNKKTFLINFAFTMLTEDEKSFIDYWEHNRVHKRKVLKQLSVGLPLGVLLVAAIFLNFFSGWDKRALVVINNDPSLIIIIIIACLLIVAFIVIFSVRHKWDLDEQHYKELITRRDRKE